MSTPNQPEPGGQRATGVVSLLLMLGGALLAATQDVALGAALLAIGAALAPSAAWWRRDADKTTEKEGCD